MRLLRTFAALLLGLPMATPIPVAAEDAPLAPEVQRRVAVVVLARRIRGYAVMARASSDCQVEKGRLPRRQASQSLAISLEELGISRRVLTNPLVVAIVPAPARRFLPVATASDRSGLGLNRSFLRGEDFWASISIPVPIAMPTAARSAVLA